MAPKNKGKKGKKNDDDDYWEQAGEAVESNKTASINASDDEGASFQKPKGGFSAFSSFVDTPDAEALEEDEGEGGGLMSLLKTNQNKKKDKKDKKKSKANAFDLPVEDAQEDEEIPTPSKQATEVTAEDLADEEWGPMKEKKKKDKKGKKKGKGAAEDDEDEASKAAQGTPTAPENEEDEAQDAGPKILSKKEKEKLKKEREKAKKKAQAAAKKVATATETPSTPVDETPAAAPPAEPKDEAKDEGEDEGEEQTAGTSAKDKKKKKKKTKKDDELTSTPAPSTGKKKTGIGALKALMEEKRRLEEEARLREEEERKRIEEEERKAEEEARRKEEEKQRRKEKEKAKRELARKEGRLLTKKQKEEKQMAELRKQALLASGVQIEGLQQSSGSGAPKKVVYGNRKKKPAGQKEVSPAQSRPQSPGPVSQPTAEASPPEAEAKSDWENDSNEEKSAESQVGVKDSWDASGDEDEEVETPQVKDSWDASSDEEEAPVATPATNGKPVEEAKPVKPAPVEEQTTNGQPISKPTPSNSKTPEAKPSGAPAKAVATKVSEAEPPASESEDESDSTEDSSSEEDSDEDSSDEELTKAQKMAAQRKAEAAERRAKAHEAALAARSKDNLRSPICCILGHVDTGKTKLLDKIRQTNVQEGEAGGITQQIGATYFPVEAIKQKTAVMDKEGTQEYKIPGLLIIDTPGHESFTNLRSRGSSLCNIAILVVDIMHGLEAQTLESLRLLRDRKTPFIVALNKIDRMYGWQATPDNSFRDSLAKQSRQVQREFEDRVAKTILAFAEEGLNACLYYENKNFARNVSLVPTSAITGEGVPDMIMLLVNLTQQRMSDRLMYLSELECTVLEVKVIEGLGTTIDVVLSNGIIREGEKIVSAYVHHKEVKAALGVKIVASDLEKAIAGSRLLVVRPDDDEDDLKDEVMSDLTSLLNSIDKSGRGVCVQASTLGSLEALLDFLKVSKIPVSGINIGPVHKRDVMRAATMLERAKELACILCFDVTVDKDAERLAEEMGIRLFRADIIYHLFDSFTAYNQEITEAKRRDAAPQAVWPCRLKIIATFCKRDPIIVGVDILDGSLRVGTPLAVVKINPTNGQKEIIDLGKITSLEINHKNYEVVKKSQAGGGVAVKIEHAVYQSAKMFGRHFDDKDELLSHITRQSIDVLKNNFRSDVSNEDWLLIRALKPQKLGYKQQLHRTWHIIESFAASFCALDFIGGVRTALFVGILAGGPAAIWSSYIVTFVFMTITAAVLAEICSALPLSGSIYIWAAESAGPKYARFFGFVVAWWSTTAWMTFVAGNCQTTANYLVSLLAIFEVDFPGGIDIDNIKWRAFVWAISEGLLIFAILINYLPPRLYSAIFKFSVGLMMVDFLLCLIWLPIGVSKTYGFRSAKDVFTLTYNGTGAPAGWNWILSFLFTAGTMTGFDASGHIAEETKNARVIAGKGILTSAVATGLLSFVTIILFLFCTPDFDTLFSLDAPQPFVQMYALALGRGGATFMTVLAVIGLILNTSVAIVAASRLVFAVARDGVLPLSGWISQVDSAGQPRHAITVIYIFAAALLCTILPSQVAFFSLISAGAVPTIAAYGLIALLRLTLTPNNFKNSYFFLGRYRRLLYLVAVIFNAIVVSVMISPFFFPVNAENFNFACVIFGSVTLFGILSWYFTPPEKWLRREIVLKALNDANDEYDTHNH
ncbi:Eukaryotic translation initiation factor 5B [Leucoagaricus sp. SymC.cos]|nr:Eukaryotic translation initiation factor 5B [Leucoagaricus sp. SymC.cos]